MSKADDLKSLIEWLQFLVASGGLDRKALDEAIARIETKYNDQLFPALVGTSKFKNTSGAYPANLAEAFLWKNSLWLKYKRFAASFDAQNPQPTTTNVVETAFAKHLKDNRNPIYDQHAARALWAICGTLTKKERDAFKSVLFRGENWKPIAQGPHTIWCYQLFVVHVKGLIKAKSKVTLKDLDRLLMPLGQTIKKATKDYSEFQKLCGFSGR